MVKCPKCGEVLNESDKRCPKCGYELTDNISADSQVKDKKSNNKIIAIIAAVVIIAIIVLFASGVLSNNTTVDDNDSVDDTSVYWGSTQTDKFHLPDCEWAEKISDDNKIIYQSREDAIEDGKEPCGECNP